MSVVGPPIRFRVRSFRFFLSVVHIVSGHSDFYVKMETLPSNAHSHEALWHRPLKVAGVSLRRLPCTAVFQVQRACCVPTSWPGGALSFGVRVGRGVREDGGVENGAG